MPYCVPQHIDPNKIFLVNFSELEGRLDPEQCHKERIDAINRIKGTKKYYPLSVIASFDKTITTEINTSVVYVGLENIESEYGNYIETSEKQSISSAAIFHKTDVLFPKLRPYLNKVFYASFDGICSTEFYVLKASSLVLPEYLAIFLRSSLVVNQTKHLMTGNTLPRLQTEDVKKLLVPVPPLHIQQQIVNVYNAALSQRKKKLSESKAKLASIDQYLLGELGITLPEDSHEKTFIVNYKDVDGGRLDPKSYCNNVKNLKLAIADSSFEKQPLNTFIVNESSGDWGEDIEHKDLDFANYTKCLVLRATEFDNRYNLNLENSRVKYRYISNAKLRRMNIQTNDLIIEKSGGSEDQPVGRIGILTREILDNKTIAFSNFLHKITVTGIDPQYLFFYLKTMHNIGLTDSMQSQTNGIRNLIMSEYKRQNIIVPNKQTQTKIVEHISAIRTEAKALEQEADAILEQAKKEVEEMILG